MNRIGFDPRIHPCQVQLRVCSYPDYQGIRNLDSETIDLMEGKVISYHTDQDQNGTTIREYTASNSELEQLYDFLTLEAIEKFETMPTSEKSAFECGYYDCADLRYLLIASEGRISDGSRHGIYSNDPINMAIEWMHSVTPSDFWR